MLKKHIFVKQNTRQAPAGTAKSKKKDSKKEQTSDHQIYPFFIYVFYIFIVFVFYYIFINVSLFVIFIVILIGKQCFENNKKNAFPEIWEVAHS